MHANKKGRSSYRGGSDGGVYFIPFCITCLLHYDFHQNTPTGLLLSSASFSVIKGRQRSVVRGEREKSWWDRGPNGRKLFFSNWHRGLRREKERETEKERSIVSYFLIKSVYPNGKFFYTVEPLRKFLPSNFLNRRIS